MKKLIILLICLFSACNQKELKNECDEIFHEHGIFMLQNYETKSESGKSIAIIGLMGLYFISKECKADLELKFKL